MNYPQPYIDYLLYFHGQRDFFECHEVLEEYWKQGDGQEHMWVGLIQLAVSLYHYRRGNVVGAKRMMETAIHNIREHPVSTLSLDQNILLNQMNEIIRCCELGQPYTDINLPINDADLLKKCYQLSQERGLSWGASSNLNDSLLIHKHKLRDRTEVILERNKRLALRKTK